MGRDINPDVGYDSQVVQAVPGLNLGSRCSSSHPSLRFVMRSPHPPPNSPVRGNKEWRWVAALYRRSRRWIAGKLKHLRWHLQFSHTLLWLPHSCSGWQCPCPLSFAIREHFHKRMLGHTSIQGIPIFPANIHICLRTRVAVWKKI